MVSPCFFLTGSATLGALSAWANRGGRRRNLQNLISISRQQQTIETLQASQIQQAKLSALGEMAGGIAHEINNPLAIIQTNCQLLRELVEQEDLDGGTATQIASRIESTVLRISKIVSGLLAFSRDGRHAPKKVETVARIIDQSLALCHEKLRAEGVVVSIDLEEDNLAISCRATQISQILLNLLINARDAALGGKERWIRIQARRTGDCVEITVSDSGVPIPPGIREKIFQPFFTTKEVGKGTGLGLGVSRGLAESHGGSLQLDSQPEPTRFVLTLPLAT